MNSYFMALMQFKIFSENLLKDDKFEKFITKIVAVFHSQDI